MTTRISSSSSSGERRISAVSGYGLARRRIAHAGAPAVRLGVVKQSGEPLRRSARRAAPRRCRAHAGAGKPGRRPGGARRRPASATPRGRRDRRACRRVLRNRRAAPSTQKRRPLRRSRRGGSAESRCRRPTPVQPSRSRLSSGATSSPASRMAPRCASRLGESSKSASRDSAGHAEENEARVDRPARPAAGPRRRPPIRSAFGHDQSEVAVAAPIEHETRSLDGSRNTSTSWSEESSVSAASSTPMGLTAGGRMRTMRVAPRSKRAAAGGAATASGCVAPALGQEALPGAMLAVAALFGVAHGLGVDLLERGGHGRPRDPRSPPALSSGAGGGSR